jgi:hypothetical protein
MASSPRPGIGHSLRLAIQTAELKSAPPGHPAKAHRLVVSQFAQQGVRGTSGRQTMPLGGTQMSEGESTAFRRLPREARVARSFYGRVAFSNFAESASASLHAPASATPKGHASLSCQFPPTGIQHKDSTHHLPNPSVSIGLDAAHRFKLDCPAIHGPFTGHGFG